MHREESNTWPSKQGAREPLIRAIEFRDVDFCYDEKRVLDHLSFKVAKGEIKIILSGMQKRLSIARALVGNPTIVLFDEPTVALDPPTSGTICDLIIELRDLENVSSIVVTHEMDVVKYLTSEYVTVTDKGKLQFKDDSEPLSVTNTTILRLRNAA